jgi:hypothetical protein
VHRAQWYHSQISKFTKFCCCCPPWQDELHKKFPLDTENTAVVGEFHPALKSRWSLVLTWMAAYGCNIARQVLCEATLEINVKHCILQNFFLHWQWQSHAQNVKITPIHLIWGYGLNYHLVPVRTKLLNYN